MDGKLLNLKRDKIEKLKAVMPEAFTEGRIDWEKLKAALGENIEFKNERYVLNWAGKTDATEENMLFELLLKSGRSLNSAIESANDYYRINDGEMVIALFRIDEKIVDSILENKPQVFITLDRLFKNNDQLKTNTLLQMKDAGIEFKVV